MALMDALPNAILRVIEGHQHAAMDTAPERFVDEIMRFAPTTGTTADVNRGGREPHPPSG
jgi:hypothetical protein